VFAYEVHMCNLLANNSTLLLVVSTTNQASGWAGVERDEKGEVGGRVRSSGGTGDPYGMK